MSSKDLAAKSTPASDLGSSRLRTTRALQGNRKRSVVAARLDQWLLALGRYRAVAVLSTPYALLFVLLWSGYLWKMFVVGSDVTAGQAGTTILWSAPDGRHWFGIDAEGRDLLVRSLRAGASTASTALFATTLGVASALAIIAPITLLGRNAVSRSMRAITGVTACFPAYFIALIFAAGLGAGFWPTSFILAGLVMLYALASVARWVHEVEDDRHVISTRVLGLRRTQVLRIAVWPILWPRLLAFCASLLPAVVLAEATLSFSGFGIGHRNLESLGTVLADGRAFMFEGPWMFIAPGILLSVVTLSFASLAWIIRAVVRDGTNPRLV